jgi:hypothetical protein
VSIAACDPGVLPVEPDARDRIDAPRIDATPIDTPDSDVCPVSGTSINPSLVVNDPAMLTGFTLARVIDRLRVTSGAAATQTPRAIYQAWMRTFNATAASGDCDDASIDPNHYGLMCPRGPESKLATVDPFAPKNLVPPASVPQGPRPPVGQWLLEWEKAYNSPVARRSDTSFTINARFNLCSYGKNPFDTIKPPSVIETADSVVVTFWADSPAPPVFEPGPQDCPYPEFGPSSPTYTVQLSAPLGDRWVYDGRPYGPNLKMDPNFRAD